jgi:hypothetical protein
VVSLFYYDGPGAKDPVGANNLAVWTTWLDHGVDLMRMVPDRVTGKRRKAYTG